MASAHSSVLGSSVLASRASLSDRDEPIKSLPLPSKDTNNLSLKSSLSSLEKLKREEVGSPPSASDLRAALGMGQEDASLRARSPPFQRFNGNQEPNKENDFIQMLENASADLADVTEGDSYQLNALQFALGLFPIWLLYVLVAAGFVHLPFTLPFLG